MLQWLGTNPLWLFINRIKLHFLWIFYSMNYTFLHRYGYEEPHLLLLTFTLLNFSLHLFNNYYDLEEDVATQQAGFLKNKRVLGPLAVACLLGSLALTLYHGFSLLAFVLIFAMAHVYSAPIFGFRTKDVLYLKNFCGSFCWWYLPFVLLTVLHTEHAFVPVFMENLLILAIFIPFEPLWDIKDLAGDRKAGVITIPVKFGVPATKLLVFCMFLLVALFMLQNQNWHLLIFLVPLMLFTLRVHEKTPLAAFQIMMFWLPAFITTEIVFFL